jgi:hypothetical protein
VALEACEVAVQTSWFDRQERRLDEAFGGMMPDELPGAVVVVAGVWLDDAYDNIARAQACLTGRSQHEEEQIAALGEHPEPPDGETSAEKARRLWMTRARQQTSCVSHIAQEVCEDSTKANWGVWAYRKYRKLLDNEVVAVRRMYTEANMANLSVRERKEALRWVKCAHHDV